MSCFSQMNPFLIKEFKVTVLCKKRCKTNKKMLGLRRFIPIFFTGKNPIYSESCSEYPI